MMHDACGRGKRDVVDVRPRAPPNTVLINKLHMA